MTRGARLTPILPAMVLALVAMSGAVLAQTDAFTPEQAAAEERAQLVAAKRQSAEALARARQLDARADALGDAAEAARVRAAAIAASIQSAEADISAGEARLALVRRKLAAQQARLAAQQGPLVRLTAGLQMITRRPPMAVLAQPGSIQDIAHMRALLSATLPQVEARTAAVRRELARLVAVRGQTRTALGALADSRRRLAETRGRLTRLENERRVQSRALAGSARLEETRAIGLGERARDIVELMDNLAGDVATRDALIGLPGPLLRPANPTRAGAAPLDAAAPVPAGRPAYRLPAVGRIVTGFGEVSDNGVTSRGLTIATRPGAQIVAPADGRVAFAGDYRGYGRILIIDHRDGWTTLITGLIGTGVAVGDEVAQGEPVGRTGPARPRVTVELRRAGRPVDVAALVG